MPGMQVREPGTVVYLAGVMTPMVVVEPDQWRPAKQLRQIKVRLESEPDAPGLWVRSELVTGG